MSVQDLGASSNPKSGFSDDLFLFKQGNRLPETRLCFGLFQTTSPFLFAD